MTTGGYDSPTDVAGTDDLRELALDMRWSWDHGADELWKQIDPELWELTRSPWVVLQTAAVTKLDELCRNPAFCEKARALTRQQRESRGRTLISTYLTSNLQRLTGEDGEGNHPRDALRPIVTGTDNAKEWKGMSCTRIGIDELRRRDEFKGCGQIGRAGVRSGASRPRR